MSIPDAGKENTRPLAGRGHVHVVFSIQPITADGSCCLTVSSDRQLVAYDTRTFKPSWTLPCIGGHVAAVAVCPSDSARVAIGCGDNLIRIWHTQASKPYQVDSVWKGIQARVRAVRRTEKETDRHSHKRKTARD